MSIDDILDDILRREGGYTDHPSDRGGCTNWGITLTALEAHRGHPVTCDDLKRLHSSEAKDIYRRLYIESPGLDQLNTKLSALMIDFGVHSGPRTAIKALQKVVGVTTDGILGPATLRAMRELTEREVYMGVLRQRGLYLARVLQRDPSQRAFAAGWLVRLMEFAI